MSISSVIRLCLSPGLIILYLLSRVFTGEILKISRKETTMVTKNTGIRSERDSMDPTGIVSAPLFA